MSVPKKYKNVLVICKTVINICFVPILVGIAYLVATIIETIDTYRVSKPNPDGALGAAGEGMLFFGIFALIYFFGFLYWMGFTFKQKKNTIQFWLNLFGVAWFPCSIVVMLVYPHLK